ncbi:hypothetical protein BJY59DRAFT_176102 [Rhodotorula toruloides]
MPQTKSRRRRVRRAERAGARTKRGCTARSSRSAFARCWSLTSRWPKSASRAMLTVVEACGRPGRCNEELEARCGWMLALYGQQQALRARGSSSQGADKEENLPREAGRRGGQLRREAELDTLLLCVVLLYELQARSKQQGGIAAEENGGGGAEAGERRASEVCMA